MNAALSRRVQGGLIVLALLIALSLTCQKESVARPPATEEGEPKPPVSATIGVVLDRSGPAPLLRVDGEPMLILGVKDPKGFSKGMWDNSPPRDYERYYAEAAALGFNVVAVHLPWYAFETGPGIWDDTALRWHQAQALQHDLRLSIIWAGSNLAGESNGVPAYIRNDPSYRLVVDAQGNAGKVYSWACEKMRDAETRALRALARWIRENDPEHRFVMLQLESELRLPSKWDRSYDACSEALFQQGDYPDGETFNQEVDRRYIQHLASAWKEELPQFPVYLNVWPNEPGSPVPVPFDDPRAQEFVQGWLDDVPAVDWLGPDIYGWNPAYVDAFATGRNVVMVPEKGLQGPPRFRTMQTPYYDPFLLFDAQTKGLGLVIYQLVAEDLHLFPGLLDRRTVLGGQDFRWKESAYRIRNSFRPLREAMPVLARAHGTERVKYFLSSSNGVLPVLSLPGARVEVRPRQGTAGPIRGSVVETGERDFTILGVGFEAIVTLADGRWSNPIVERGRWEPGARWTPLASAREGSWELLPDGSLRVILDDEDLGEIPYQELQYLVRIREREE